MSRKTIMIIIALLAALSVSVSHADDSTLWTTTTTPDALIILDNSGSMAELPNGTNPTLYVCGTTSCSGSGPYYVTVPSNALTATSFYVAGTSCTIDGPYTISSPALMYTGTLYVAGTDCSSSYNGPYLTAKGSNQLNTATNFYIASTSSCGGSSVAYYPSSGTGHTKNCTATSYFPTTGYVVSDCTNGPFYTASGSGHTTACTRYTQCSNPFSGSSSAYTETDCTTGNFYRASGTGHTTSCPSTDSVCSTSNSKNPFSSSLNAYSSSDCVSGPFYKTSGTGHTTVCQYCSQTCTPSSSGIPWSDSSCGGPFYSSSGTGHTTNCSKIEIAKRALFDLLDSDNSNAIDSADITQLGMRLGYMRYYGCSSSNSNLAYTNSSSCISLVRGITLSDNTTTTPYANIYCNDTTCASTVTSCTTSSPSYACVVGSSASGGTPLANALREAKSYLDYHKALDASATCRQKSIIVVTDGADTYSCSGDGSNTNLAQRISPIYNAQKAAAANYKVYVVGFGAAMPQTLQNTLNWMAYYGGTRNPNTTQSGSTTGVTVSTGTDPCSGTTDPTSHNLNGYAFMASNPTELVSALSSAIESIQEATYSFSSQASVAAARVQGENYIYEASFEPRYSSGINKEPFWPGHLKKYRLNETTGALITPAAWDAGAKLRDTDASARNMFTYTGSGTAGSTLTSFDTSNMADRNFGGTATSCGTLCQLVVGFFRGDSTYNLEYWKLGDLFHTNPVVVASPSLYFYDPRECGSTSFSAFRNNNTRQISNGHQIIVVGGNDGQFHAFRTGTSTTDYSTGGDEVWSFIPPNVLQKIAPIAHNSHADRSTLAVHDLFIDGPVQVADAWVPSTDSSGTSKTCSSTSNCDWKTLAVFDQAGGSGNYLWSSSSGCYSTSTSAFSATYSSSTPYYCGLYALDVTDSLNAPKFQFILNPTSSQGPFLGQAYSKMQIGRVKIDGNEKWVGLIGTGFSDSSCTSVNGATSYTNCINSGNDYRAGKGFFVVDLKNGSILWSFTHGDSVTSTSTGGTSPYMDFSAPAAPLALDLDNDQFIDTVYMGDLGGNIWRFRFCPKDNCAYCGASNYNSSPCTPCGRTNWKASRFFASTDTERGSGLSTASNTHKQIFTSVTSAKDDSGNSWVYFGTGENNDPTSKPTGDTSSTKNRLYGIKEVNLSQYDSEALTYPTFTSADLTNITSSFNSSTCAEVSRGWYYNLSTNSLTRSDSTVINSPVGEKMISDPAISNKVVYFSTYVPDQGTGTACGLAGDAFLYKVNSLTGCGANAGSGTSSVQYIGHGIGSSILVSWRPGLTGKDIYATASGGAGTAALTQELTSNPGVSSANNIIYWKDKRLE